MGFIQWLIIYRYIAIVPIAILEGPIISIILGFLLNLGYFSFLPLYLVLIACDIAGDIFWYIVGSHVGLSFATKYGKYVGLSEEKIKRVEHLFQKYPTRILFISKITMGLGFAPVMLFTAALMKVPFRKYITVNVIGQFIWTGMLLWIGYSFGGAYTAFNKGFTWISHIALAVILCVALYGFGTFMQNHFSRIQKP